MDFAQYVLSPPYLEWLCRGAFMTLVIAVLSSALAALIAIGVVQLRLGEGAAPRAIGFAFVMIFRNLPLVPLLLFLMFCIPSLWAQLLGRPFPRGLELHLLLAGLSLNTAAYLAEILRAGFGAIAPQQIEAARTLGLRARTIRWSILYPQAIRIVAPTLASRFIHNMKNSSLAIVLPLPLEQMEVAGQAGRIAGRTFSWAEPLVFAAATYLVFAIGLGWILNRWAFRAHARIQALA